MSSKNGSTSLGSSSTTGRIHDFENFLKDFQERGWIDGYTVSTTRITNPDTQEREDNTRIAISNVRRGYYADAIINEWKDRGFEYGVVEEYTNHVDLFEQDPQKYHRRYAQDIMSKIF